MVRDVSVQFCASPLEGAPGSLSPINGSVEFFVAISNRGRIKGGYRVAIDLQVNLHSIS
jgi:hypothetical protein